MKIKTGIMSAVFAGTLALSFAGEIYLPVVTAVAATVEKTYDDLYVLTETVDYYDYFYTSNLSSVQEALEKKLKSAIGKSSLERVTFKDLQKVTTLNLSGLELEDVPACINYMVNLTSLNLSDNLLENSGLRRLNLEGCTKLKTIDLRENYLTYVPSWFVSERVTNGRISDNFIESDSPRGIKTLETAFYYTGGDYFNENTFIDRIIDSIRYNNNTGDMLPEYFYLDAVTITADSEPIEEDIFQLAIDMTGFEQYYENNRIVFSESASKLVNIPVRLYTPNPRCTPETEVSVYLMNGSDLSSIKMILRSLLSQYSDGDKAIYTETSWAEYASAQKAAQAVYDYENADVSLMKTAFDMLNSARSALKFSASGNKNVLATLTNLVNAGKDYKEANYTPESWASFKAAYDNITALSKDKNATLSDAENGISAFIKAINGLRTSVTSVPGKIAKSVFESNYGLNTSITSGTGYTTNGRQYHWSFNGKNITAPADFNPEVKDSDAAEPSIMIEAGSADSYYLFATAQTGAFPGKATLTIDKCTLPAGSNYYLYKWDNSAKRSTLVGKASLNDTVVTAELVEGGVYYISSMIQNFELVSGRLNIDNQSRQLIIPLSNGTTASALRSYLDYGNYVQIEDENGKTVSAGQYMLTGMTVNAPNREKYTVIVTGDINDDGRVRSDDALALLQAAVNDKLSDLTGADVNGDGKITSLDALEILRYLANN